MAGTLSDRLGRRPVLVAGIAVVAMASVGVASAPSYPVMVACRLLGGIGGGSYMGAAFAAAADPFPPERRGRALGWIMTGQSLSLLLGVPAFTFIGGFVGWRGVFEIHAVGTVLAGLLVWLVARHEGRANSAHPLPMRDALRLLDWRSGALLAASTAERICYSGVVVFLPTYFLVTYGVSLRALAVMLAVVPLGYLLGNVLGGHLADRFSQRLLLFVASLLTTATLALPVLRWEPGVGEMVVLAFTYATASSIGRPALLSSLSGVSSRARGAVLGLNVTFSSLGWLTASGLGGWLITTGGFGALGGLVSGVGLIGAALAWLAWLGRTPSLARSRKPPASLPMR